MQRPFLKNPSYVIRCLRPLVDSDRGKPCLGYLDLFAKEKDNRFFSVNK
jgi:hypothetical protein